MPATDASTRRVVCLPTFMRTSHSKLPPPECGTQPVPLGVSGGSPFRQDSSKNCRKRAVTGHELPRAIPPAKTPCYARTLDRHGGNANSRFFTDCYLLLSHFDPFSASFPTRSSTIRRRVSASYGC